jgi:hypothetical protein
MGLHRPASRVWYDAHNQGRAIDLSQIWFSNGRISVWGHWGMIPIPGGDGTWITEDRDVFARIHNCDPPTRIDPLILPPLAASYGRYHRHPHPEVGLLNFNPLELPNSERRSDNPQNVCDTLHPQGFDHRLAGCDLRHGTDPSLGDVFSRCSQS